MNYLSQILGQRHYYQYKDDWDQFLPIRSLQSNKWGELVYKEVML